jgi:glycosyltransferase involved in cell wall biosynthesis
MNRLRLFVDIRASGQSGLGRYVDDVVLPVCKKLENKFDIFYLVNELRPDLNNNVLINVMHFSIKEQFLFFTLREKYDFIWFPTLAQPLCGFSNRIVTIHDFAQFIFQEKKLKLRLRKYISKLFFRSIIFHSYLIIFNSKFTQSEFKKYFPLKANSKDQISIDLSTLDTKKAIRNKKNNNSILFVGNLKHTKNLKLLVESLGNLEGFHLTIVTNGYGRIKDNSFSYLNKIDNAKITILWNLTKQELTALYNKSDLYVMPSFYEGWGYTPYEALQCGCNIIVSNIPPINQFLKSYDFKFDPKSRSELKKLLTNYLIMNEKEKKDLFLKTKLMIPSRQDEDVVNETYQLISRVLSDD